MQRSWKCRSRARKTRRRFHAVLVRARRFSLSFAADKRDLLFSSPRSIRGTRMRIGRHDNFSSSYVGTMSLAFRADKRTHQRARLLFVRGATAYYVIAWHNYGARQRADAIYGKRSRDTNPDYAPRARFSAARV